MTGLHAGWCSYQTSKAIGGPDPDFYALLMAAMRRADTPNAARLRGAFPEIWDELQARYNAPGGVLASDPPGLLERWLAKRGEWPQ